MSFWPARKNDNSSHGDVMLSVLWSSGRLQQVEVYEHTMTCGGCPSSLGFGVLGSVMFQLCGFDGKAAETPTDELINAW